MIYINSDENEKSFIELYEKYYKRIYNYIYRSLLNKEITEDLTANTFLKALNFIKKKNPYIKNFSAWIYKIATNELLMHLRSKNSKNNVSLEDEKMQLSNSLEDKKSNTIDKYMEFLMIKGVIRSLKPEERILIEMHFFENKNYSEMSEILNVKETTLRSKIHRILKKINKLLT